MGKSISGTAFYEIKATNPNQVANYDAGKLTKSIGDDLATFVGKPMQGLVVKANDATKVVEKVKKDLVAKKVQQPWMRAGISGSDVIFLVTDLKGKYEESCTLVSGYVPLREKLKKQEGMVVNLDKGDQVIDQAATDMANAHKTTAVEGKDAKFAGISGTTPIVLLAHGDEDKNSSGTIYGKDFAGKTPQQIVDLLTANPDKAKRLSPDYSGVVYLDGCFTAQGGAMENYTKQVWDLLKKKVKNVKVKGNLGLAATTSKGDEIITTTEADTKAKKLKEVADADNKKFWDDKIKPFLPLWNGKYKQNAEAFNKDPGVVKVTEEYHKYVAEREKKLFEEVKKIPGFQVKNMVGQFGLTRLH